MSEQKKLLPVYVALDHCHLSPAGLGDHYVLCDAGDAQAEIDRLSQELDSYEKGRRILVRMVDDLKKANEQLRMAERMNVETIAVLNKRLEWIERICQAAYQLAGLVGAPRRFLDALSLHEDVNVDELLPVTIEECEEFNKKG